jgi:integrase
MRPGRPLVEKRFESIDLAAGMRVKEGIEGFIEVVANYKGRRKSKAFPLVSTLGDRLEWQHQTVEQMRLNVPLPLPPPRADETIREAVAAYLASETGQRRANAESCLRYWVQWYGDVPRTDLTLGQVQAFFEFVTPQTGKKFSASRKNKMRSYLISVWKYRDGKRHTCPALDMPSFTEPQSPPREITPAQAQAILDAMGDSASRALLGLLYTTGVRPGELKTLREPDFFLEEPVPYVAVRTAKGGKPRIVALPPLGVDAARDVIRHQAWHSVWNLMRDMQRAAVRAGIDVKPTGVHPSGRKQHAITPYSFRHAYAMNMRRSGAGIQDIADALGHSSLTTTRKYAKAIPEQQAIVLRAMWEKVGLV